MKSTLNLYLENSTSCNRPDLEKWNYTLLYLLRYVSHDISTNKNSSYSIQNIKFKKKKKVQRKLLLLIHMNISVKEEALSKSPLFLADLLSHRYKLKKKWFVTKCLLTNIGCSVSLKSKHPSSPLFSLTIANQGQPALVVISTKLLI